MSQTVLTDTFFANFDLHPLLQQGLDDSGFTRCTPIQEMTLPLALAGRDVAGQAQTGTGKTCAFLVALMNRLLTTPAVAERKDSDPRALIIAPTRELAIQIEKDAKAIGRHTGLRVALIYGGVDYDKQRQQLKDGCDIIIATPGRMLDYHKQGVFNLNSVEVMVIDEADRMFDLGFIKDVRFIFRKLPPREQRQVLLFSATLSHRVLELAYEHMHEAEKLVVESDNVTADKVRQVVYFPAKEEKMPLLLNLIDKHKPSRSIIFVNTKAAAERITERVKRHGCRVGAISGDVPQLKRQKLLQRFQDGQLDILVATDVAARGQPRLQLRPAARGRGLRAPDRAHRAPRCRGRRDQLRLRPVRDVAAGHRDLYRPEYPGRADGSGVAGDAEAARGRCRVRRECRRRQRRVRRRGAAASRRDAAPHGWFRRSQRRAQRLGPQQCTASA